MMMLLQQVLHCLSLNRWPNNPGLQKFPEVRDELSTSQGLLLRETWIVMPESRVLKPSPWPMRTKEWCAPSNYCDRRFGDPAWTSKPSSKQAYPVSLPNHKLYQNHFVLQQCTPDRGKRFILTFVGIFPW